MKAHIYIKKLHVPAIIGVHEFEKNKPQDIFLNVKLSVDVLNACQSDHLADTVDYDQMSQMLVQYIQSTQFELLEALGYACMERIFLFSKKIESVELDIEKPNALKQAENVVFSLYSKTL